jgi:Heterokaryon incompatibility protein (HET)
MTSAVIQNNQPEARPFVYDDIDPNSNQIRLLRILRRDSTSEVHLEIFHTNLDDNPTYKALSYTWGSPADPRHGIHLNGYQFEVRENLWLALRRFQAGDVAPVIWIDAICINQSSDNERNHQVAKMKRIYEQATEVVVWLGPSYDDSDLAIKFAKELYDYRESVGWVTQRFSMPDIKLALQALGYLLGREYWWRIWIVQEITVAQRIVFYCGDVFIDAESLRSVQQLFHRMSDLRGFSRDLLAEALQGDELCRNRVLFDGIQGINNWKQILLSTKPSFYTCVIHHYFRISSDPRDMIYALAALANETGQYRVEVNYSLTTREVFTKFAQLEIKASSKLDIITRVVPHQKLHNLPSWVPDWSTPSEAQGHIFLYSADAPEFQFSAAAQSKAVVTFYKDSLTFRGVKICCIRILGPRSSMKTRFDVEDGLIALYNWWKLVVGIGETSSAEHEAFVRTLICDEIKQEHLGPSTKSEFFFGILGYVGLLFSNANLIDPSSFILNYWTLFLDQRAQATPTKSRSTIESELIAIMKAWTGIIYDFIWDHPFFISSSKSMGLASREIREGDIICIPLGCCHPIILRKEENHYINLGEAYVDGYMYGEAMEMLERGELKLEEFELR